MPIVQVPYGNALPTVENDYVRQNNLLYTQFLNTNRAQWDDGAGNIKQGTVFQVGGAVFYCNAATAIGGVASNYIKLTPAGAAPNMTLTPAYVANLAGVTWSSVYNGYYDGSGNAYIFDELTALQNGDITVINTKNYTDISRTMHGTYNAVTPTADDIFQEMKNYISEIDKYHIITGGASRVSVFGADTTIWSYKFDHAYRFDVNNIYIHWVGHSMVFDTLAGTINGTGNNSSYFQITNGSATVYFDRVSISW